MQWFGGGKMELVPAVANRFLEMMSETVLGAGCCWSKVTIAHAKLAERRGRATPTTTFYTGKVFSAQYFARNVLPGVQAKAQLVAKDDRSAIDIPIAAFGA